MDNKNPSDLPNYVFFGTKHHPQGRHTFEKANDLFHDDVFSDLFCINEVVLVQISGLDLFHSE